MSLHVGDTVRLKDGVNVRQENGDWTFFDDPDREFEVVSVHHQGSLFNIRDGHDYQFVRAEQVEST
jgi:hypothetical protein